MSCFDFFEKPLASNGLRPRPRKWSTSFRSASTKEILKVVILSKMVSSVVSSNLGCGRWGRTSSCCCSKAADSRTRRSWPPSASSCPSPPWSSSADSCGTPQSSRQWWGWAGRGPRHQTLHTWSQPIYPNLNDYEDQFYEITFWRLWLFIEIYVVRNFTKWKR